MAELAAAATSVFVDAPADTLRVQVQNRRTALEPARLAVLEYLRPRAPGAKAVYQVELVLEETLMNTIWHAFDDDAPHWIDLQVAVHPNAIELCFEDDGRPFDPTQRAAPDLPASLEQATPGGLGLMLVHKLAQSMQYQRIGARNQLRIHIARN